MEIVFWLLGILHWNSERSSMMSQEITLNEFEVFYFMKKGLEGILTVNSGLPEYLFFFSLCRMERSCIFKQKSLETSFEEWYYKFGTNPSVGNCLHYTLEYAIQKLSCGVWSLCQANLLAFLHAESLSRKESVNKKQERNLWKLFATFLLCIWTSVKMLKINLYFSILCCWGNSCDYIQNSSFLLLPITPAPLVSIFVIYCCEQERQLPVSVNYSFREKLRAFS